MTNRAAVKLGDVAEFIRGVTYKPSDVTSINDRASIACMRTKNIQIDLEDDDLVYIPRAAVKKEKLLKVGDIIVSSANSWNLVGKCAWISELGYESTFGGFTSVLRAVDSRVNPRYLYHWFSTNDVQIHVRSFGQQTTNISNLNHKRCLELDLPLPPLDEQRRIAAILDKADALRRKRKRALELLDGLTQSIFLEMFGDPSSNPNKLRLGRIGDLLESTQYGTSEKAGNAGAYPILRMGNLTDNGHIVVEDLKYIDLSSSNVDRYTVRKGDILFNRTNSADLVGKTAVFKLNETYAYAGYLVRARPREGVMPEYISGYLNSRHGKATLRRMAKSIVGMANINAREMQNIPILIPHKNDQHVYRDRLNVIARKAALGEKASLAAAELFDTLQHRAFSGYL